MKKEPIFQGVATALVTPTTANGVDYDALKKLVEWQIQEGVNALVICGTTGESSTLSDEEHRQVLKVALELDQIRLRNRLRCHAGGHPLL